jgi:type IV pilus assembly protein PilO
MAGLPPMTKRDQNLVVMAIVAIVGAGAFWYLYWTPENVTLATLEARVAKLDSTNAKAKKEVAGGKLDQLRKDVVRANESLALMRQLVPTGNEVPVLLDQVSVAAREAGLEMAGVKPEPTVMGEQFDTYRYSIKVIGSYHQTTKFLADIGSLTRIMAPVGVSIVPNENPTNTRRRAARGEASLGVDFELQTYVAKAQRPAAAGGGN